ncbi:transglycosylase domain-containing protein [Pseudonocardia bannensis]|uniref:Penicillin-binding protein n=1 Tax=Pseudonocardia bannensis TaxID=630973 RepID=A0A848DEJ5_9PSEU|nr:transglycosylase domain-containing protein [Pseudonocardia bannensis]NMH91007.1 penicillin-binding protein [Pseudonocardia bannensis]
MRWTQAAARLAALTVVAGLIFAASMLTTFGGTRSMASRISESTIAGIVDLRAGILPATTTVTDSGGEAIAYLYDQYRYPVAASQISPVMKAAIVAIEDRRFYSHGGVDARGALRALVINSGGRARQGGSTLTQQYVKNYDLYVTAQTDEQRQAAVAPSYTRKIREAELAVTLDRELSKDEILARYLNIVYLGHSAYGVEAAARLYFDTTAAELTLPQAALLAGLVQSPAEYDPIRRPAAAVGRRNLVIDQMRQQGAITGPQAAAASAAPLGVQDDGEVPAGGCFAAGDAGYFCTYVVAFLEQAGITAEQLTRGGYTVRTTLDSDALAQVKAAVDDQVDPATPKVANVMTVVAPGTDAHPVLAMAANRTYGNQPGQTSYGMPYRADNMGAGSVYKIFTAAAALEQGVAGIDSILDVPESGYISPIYRDDNGRPIQVTNITDYPARLSLADALARSPNTAFVKLLESTGVPAVVDMAQRLGVTSLATTPADGKPGSPSLADVARSRQQASFTLGVSPTSSLELANVAATLASQGTWCPPSPIESVTDRTGAPVALPQPACRQVLDPGIADTLMYGLGNDDRGGGTSADAAASQGWTRPVAGKTGTTQDHKSAAFVGATPQLAGASIVFDDSPSPQPICDGSPPYSCPEGTLYGGTVPARTWYRAMGEILAGEPAAPLPDPDPRYLTGRIP